MYPFNPPGTPIRIGEDFAPVHRPLGRDRYRFVRPFSYPHPAPARALPSAYLPTLRGIDMLRVARGTQQFPPSDDPRRANRPPAWDPSRPETMPAYRRAPPDVIDLTDDPLELPPPAMSRPRTPVNAPSPAPRSPRVPWAGMPDEAFVPLEGPSAPPRIPRVAPVDAPFPENFRPYTGYWRDSALPILPVNPIDHPLERYRKGLYFDRPYNWKGPR